MDVFFACPSWDLDQEDSHCKIFDAVAVVLWYWEFLCTIWLILYKVALHFFCTFHKKYTAYNIYFFLCLTWKEGQTQILKVVHVLISWFYPKCNERSDPLWKFCGDNSSLNWIIKFRKKNITLF